MTTWTNLENTASSWESQQSIPANDVAFDADIAFDANIPFDGFQLWFYSEDGATNWTVVG